MKKYYYVTLYWNEWFLDENGKDITGNEEHEDYEIEAENEEEAVATAMKVLDYQCSGYADYDDEVKDYEIQVYDWRVEEVPQEDIGGITPYREKRDVWAPENELDEAVEAFYKQKKTKRRTYYDKLDKTMEIVRNNRDFFKSVMDELDFNQIEHFEFLIGMLYTQTDSKAKDTFEECVEVLEDLFKRNIRQLQTVEEVKHWLENVAEI